MPKIFLIANHPNDRRESMDRYVDLLWRGLVANGTQVEILRPRQSLVWLAHRSASLAKWLAYFDKFSRFPRFLRRYFATVRKSRESFVVHICDQADAVYSSALGGIPHLNTCHDLIAIRSALGEVPLQRTRFTGRIYQRLIQRGLRRAALVACVSDATRQDYERLVAPPGQRVVVVRNPLNYPYRPLLKETAVPLVDAAFQRSGLKRPDRYFFHVGGNQWYKNRLGLLRIYRYLASSGDTPPLVLAGQPLPPELTSFITTSGLADHVKFVGKVSNEELNALYCQAEALVFPSLMEGFGWPVIEAQASGCPVIASNIKIFREIGGGAMCFINPEDVTGSATAIRSFLKSTDQAKARLIKRGQTNAAAYSPAEMLETYLNLYGALSGVPPSLTRNRSQNASSRFEK